MLSTSDSMQKSYMHPHLEKPAWLALCLGKTKRIEVAVPRADVDHAIDHGRRGTDVISCCKSPLLGSGGGVKGVEAAIIGANVDHPIGHRRRGFDVISCRESPLLSCRGGIKRVEVVVCRANVDHPIGHRRRGRDACFRVKNPLRSPGGGIKGVEVAVPGADVDHAIDHGRRGKDVISCLIKPLFASGGGVKGVEVTIIGADVDHAIDHGRRRLDVTSYRKSPLLRQMYDGGWIENLLIGVGAAMLGIKAKHDAVGRYKAGIASGSRSGGCLSLSCRLHMGRCHRLSLSCCLDISCCRRLCMVSRELHGGIPSPSTSQDEEKQHAQQKDGSPGKATSTKLLGSPVARRIGHG